MPPLYGAIQLKLIVDSVEDNKANVVGASGALAATTVMFVLCYPNPILF